mmetsp:Transcript_22982/g.39103  ORF Transcript_22982/g.39103 Transcript_22982/m.39103 type:complete len:229 (-) Transcript_22982:63-749(-)
MILNDCRFIVFLNFRIQNFNRISHRMRIFESWLIFRQHNKNFDAQNTLAQFDVANGRVDIVVDRLTRLDHVAVTEDHCFGTLTTQFARHNNFDTFGFGLHDEAHDAVARTTHSQTAQQFVAQRLGLSHSTQTAVIHTFSIQFQRTVWEFETFLHDRCQLTNALTFLAEHIFGARGANNDFSARRCSANFYSTISIFSKFCCQQFIQFRFEDTIGDEFAFFSCGSLSHF